MRETQCIASRTRYCVPETIGASLDGPPRSRSDSVGDSATAVRDLPPLIDVPRAAADGAHVIVVRRVVAALRVGELRGVVLLARAIGGVDAPLQRLGGDSGRQRRPRVTGRAKLLHVAV